MPITIEHQNLAKMLGKTWNKMCNDSKLIFPGYDKENTSTEHNSPNHLVQKHRGLSLIFVRGQNYSPAEALAAYLLFLSISELTAVKRVRHF